MNLSIDSEMLKMLTNGYDVGTMAYISHIGNKLLRSIHIVDASFTPDTLDFIET